MHAELQLPATLTIYEVRDLAQQWLTCVAAQPSRLSLDVSELQELDGAGFQLVISLLKALPETSVQIKTGRELQAQGAWLVQQLQVQDLVVSEVVC